MAFSKCARFSAKINPTYRIIRYLRPCIVQSYLISYFNSNIEYRCIMSGIGRQAAVLALNRFSSNNDILQRFHMVIMIITISYRIQNIFHASSDCISDHSYVILSSRTVYGNRLPTSFIILFSWWRTSVV